MASAGDASSSVGFPVWRAGQGRLAAADLEACVALLRRGGVVLVPTETVYGLAADARNEAALLALLALKGRSPEKTLPLQVSGLDSLGEVVQGELSAGARRLMQQFCPGPLTAVLPGRPDLPPPVRGGGGTVGVRIPDHPVMLAILRGVEGPLAVTSANRTGEPPATTVEMALTGLCGDPDGAVDAGPCLLGAASTVVDLTASSPRILRPGPIGAAEIHRVFEGQ